MEVIVAKIRARNPNPAVRRAGQRNARRIGMEAELRQELTWSRKGEERRWRDVAGKKAA